MHRRLTSIVYFWLAAVSAGSIALAQRIEQAAPTPEIPPGAALVAIDSLPGPDTWPAGKVLTSDTDHERRIRARLEEPFTHDFTGMTLADLVPLLEKRLQCTVVLDRAALAADGKERPEEVELAGKAQGRALRKELASLFGPRDLKSIVSDDCLLITTRIAAETLSEIRIYQVHDLVVSPRDVTAHTPDFEQLERLVQGHIAAGTWSSQGGTIADLRSFHGPGILAFVVRQSEEGHEQVAALLDQLRAAKSAELARLQKTPALWRPSLSAVGGEAAIGDLNRAILSPPPPLPRGRVFRTRTEAETRIEKVLSRTTEFEFKNTRLDEIADVISKRHQIPVELDVPSLTADGRGPETRFTFQWHDGSLRGSLNNVLRDQGLTFAVRDDALLITTRSAAGWFDETRVYQVHDLLSHDFTRVGQTNYYDHFQEIISGMVSPETWRDGNSTHIHIFGFEGPGLQCLAIRHSPEIHGEIEQLRDMLRDAFVPEVYEAQRRRPLPPPRELSKPAAVPATKGSNFF
ncbi:MAG: hypothetical protein JNL96_04950 [Planctomycetaceae bacterium]|nr:hypothetical protein [Planctomycetaceae bacterium]